MIFPSESPRWRRIACWLTWGKTNSQCSQAVAFWYSQKSPLTGVIETGHISILFFFTFSICFLSLCGRCSWMRLLMLFLSCNLKLLHDCYFISFANGTFEELPPPAPCHAFFFPGLGLMPASWRALLSVLWYCFKNRALVKKNTQTKPFIHTSRPFGFFLISEPQAIFACNPIFVIEEQMKGVRHPPASQMSLWAFTCQHFTSIPQLP